MNDMTVDTGSRLSLIENFAEQVAGLAFQGMQNEALDKVEELQLGYEKSKAIFNILATPPSSEEAALRMKDKIIDVLTKTSAIEQNESYYNCNPDVIQNIFIQCCKGSGAVALYSLSLVNKHFHIVIGRLTQNSLNQEMLIECCPKLSIWDPEKVCQHMKPFEIFKNYYQMVPQVNGNEGVTVFYYEELTMEELVAYGKNIGVEVNIDEMLVKEDREFAKEEHSISIVTDNVFEGSLDETYPQQVVRIETKHQCQMLTARKTVYLVLRTLEISKGEKCLFKQKAIRDCIFTRVSTLHVSVRDGQSHLIIGATHWDGYNSRITFMVMNHFLANIPSVGAAGQRIFFLNNEEKK